MALQSSGAISLNEIHIEAGGSSGTTASINDSDIRGLIGKSSGATSSFSEFYGASSAFTTSVTSGSVPYQVGFSEQGSKSHTYNRPVSPSSDVGSVGAQLGWIPNSNGITWAIDQFAAAFNPGQASTSTQIRAFFRDNSLSTSVARTTQAPFYSYTWPMGDVIVASDSNFTQNVITLSSSGWASSNTFALQYTSWISGVAWSYSFSTNAQRTAAYNLLASNFYVKIEP